MSGPAPEPTRTTLVVDARFPYPGYFERPAACRLRLYQHEGRTVALLTELNDNPGASVTNCAETVAHLVVREYELDPERTTFIEHYPGRPGPKGAVRDENFDLVTFTERQWDQFKGTHWQRLDVDQVQAFIGQAWTPEHYPTPGDNR
jgi:hypothetical protein